MQRIRVEVSGYEEVRRSIARMGKAGQAAAKTVLKGVADSILIRAKLLCPVDDVDGGQLRESGRVTRPTATKNSVSTGIVFGGDPLLPVLAGHSMNVYAVVQHEDLTLKHRTGQAKFLEQPFFAAAPQVPGLLLAELDALAAEEGI
jgi:hypothetical protein